MTEPTERSRIRRLPERGSYDREIIDQIIDEALICHVAFADAEGRPVAIPTIHARVGDTIYLHGSPASRMLRTIPGQQVSVAVTHLDGLVLAKSHMHHSMNYRSVVCFGTARKVSDPEEKAAAFRAIVEHLMEGRWDGARQPSEEEFRATSVVAIEIEEASAKTRSGPPGDDEDDLGLPFWAGVIPLRLTADAPVSNGSDPLPEHIAGWSPGA